MPKPNVRDQIITAGLATLHSKGFNATSVQDITDAAGVPKGSFYNHFASKEALGVEVVRLYGERAGAMRAALDDASLPPLKRIERDFQAKVDANVNTEFACGCLLGNFSTELSAQSEQIRTELSANFAACVAALAPLIAQAQQEGSITLSEPALDLAETVIDAWQGAVLRAKAEHQRAPLDRFMKTLTSKLLR